MIVVVVLSRYQIYRIYQISCVYNLYSPHTVWHFFVLYEACLKCWNAWKRRIPTTHCAERIGGDGFHRFFFTPRVGRNKGNDMEVHPIRVWRLAKYMDVSKNRG